MKDYNRASFAKAVGSIVGMSGTIMLAVSGNGTPTWYLLLALLMMVMILPTFYIGDRLEDRADERYRAEQARIQEQIRIRQIQEACPHRRPVPVVSAGLRVAWLCLDCDRQIESEWVEHVDTPRVLKSFSHLHNRAIRWYESRKTTVDHVS